MMTKEEFNRQFETMRPKVRSYLLRLTASQHDTDDIVQDTWMRAIEGIDKFKGESSLKTWIFSIASNLVIDNLKKKKALA